jgi:hypothetical protein
MRLSLEPVMVAFAISGAGLRRRRGVALDARVGKSLAGYLLIPSPIPEDTFLGTTGPRAAD